MKSTIVLFCIIFMITISEKGLGQTQPKKSAGQTSSSNQHTRTSRSGTTILMDEKKQQKEGIVPVRTNSSTPPNSTSANKIVPQHPRRDNIFDIFDPGVIKQRGGSNTATSETAIARTHKTDSIPGKKIIVDSARNKQADFRNKPQRN